MFLCVKDCWMEGGGSETPVFLTGRIYDAIGETPEGISVLDEEREEHIIGWPGGAFFREYFVALPADEYHLAGEGKRTRNETIK